MFSRIFHALAHSIESQPAVLASALRAVGDFVAHLEPRLSGAINVAEHAVEILVHTDVPKEPSPQ